MNNLTLAIGGISIILFGLILAGTGVYLEVFKKNPTIKMKIHQCVKGHVHGMTVERGVDFGKPGLLFVPKLEGCEDLTDDNVERVMREFDKLAGVKR